MPHIHSARARMIIWLAIIAALIGIVACDPAGSPAPPTAPPGVPTALPTGLPAPLPSTVARARALETPTVALSSTPTPAPIPIPTDFNGLFWLLFLGGGAFFSAVAPWVIDRVGDLWIYARGYWPWFAWLPDLTAERKRFLSIAVPMGLVFIGWLGLTLNGSLALDEQNIFLLLSTMFEVATGKQIVFGIGQSIKAGAARRLERLRATKRGQQR